MMKRGVLSLIMLFLLVACGNGTAKNTNSTESKSEITTVAEESKIEVLYMHGKQRCITCRAIGSLTEEVITELSSDKIEMKSIDFSTTEGEKIADKYEVTFSSLIIDNGGKVTNLTEMGFKYAKNEPEEFKKNLKKTLETMLK